jgi:phage-related protein
MAAREGKQGQTVKRVALPSGKTIEVVYFNETSPAPDIGQELHVCPDCDSRLVYPTQWRETDRCSWEVSLRCPNCEWSATDVFDQDTVERFDEELDRGTDSLVDDLKRLVSANMEEEIERFSRALTHDHILPEDF